MSKFKINEIAYFTSGTGELLIQKVRINKLSKCEKYAYITFLPFHHKKCKIAICHLIKVETLKQEFKNFIKNI